MSGPQVYLTAGQRADIDLHAACLAAAMEAEMLAGAMDRAGDVFASANFTIPAVDVVPERSLYPLRRAPEPVKAAPPSVRRGRAVKPSRSKYAPHAGAKERARQMRR